MNHTIAPLFEAARGRVATSLAAATLLLGGTAAIVPAHVFAADSATPAVTASSFTWNVTLSNGTAEGGISSDLPSAITLAEIGESLSPAAQQMLTATLTQQATDAGVSLTATTPDTSSTPPATTPTPMPSTDDSGN